MLHRDTETNIMFDSNYKVEAGLQLTGASTIIGSDVYSQYNEALGTIKEIMLNINTGKVCYAVMCYGGFLGMSEKLFAVPWHALTQDTEHKRYILNIDSARLYSAPGFDKNHWPNMSDETWANDIYSYYGTHLKRTDSMHSCM